MEKELKFITLCSKFLSVILYVLILLPMNKIRFCTNLFVYSVNKEAETKRKDTRKTRAYVRQVHTYSTFDANAFCLQFETIYISRASTAVVSTAFQCLQFHNKSRIIAPLSSILRRNVMTKFVSQSNNSKSQFACKKAKAI